MKNNTRKLSLIVALVMVLGLLSAFPMIASAADAEYYITVDNANPAVGDTVTATVSVRNVDTTAMQDGICCITIPIVWDPAVLTYVSSSCPVIPNEWEDVTSVTTAGSGYITIQLADQSALGAPNSADDFFNYVIVFTAAAEGTTTIDTNSNMTSEDNNIDPVEVVLTPATVTVAGGSTEPDPEPSDKINEYYITVDNANPAVGDTVTATVSVRNVDTTTMQDGICCITIPIVWDPAVLTYVSSSCPVIPNEWEDVTSVTTAGSGYITIQLADQSALGAPNSADDFFNYVIVFTAAAEGTTTIDTNSNMTSEDNNIDPVEVVLTPATVTVAGGSTEPDPVYYTVTFQAGANGTLSGTTTVSALEGSDLSAVRFPTATANPGYKFVAWDKTSGAINSDITVTASFEYDASQWFTVTYNLDGKGKTSDATSFGPFVTGTAWSAAGITAPVVTGTGVYSFTGWDKDAPATITADVVFTAQYQADESTKYVTFVAGANGTILGKDDSDNIVANEIKRSLTAGQKVGATLDTPAAIGNENYHFVGWYTDAGELYDFNSEVTEDITLTAKFEVNAITLSAPVKTTEGGYDVWTFDVTYNDADADLSGAYITYFYQNKNGTTNINTGVFTATVIDGAIKARATAGSVAYVDIYVSEGLIDFASSDWNIIDIVIGDIVIG